MRVLPSRKINESTVHKRKDAIRLDMVRDLALLVVMVCQMSNCSTSSIVH